MPDPSTDDYLDKMAEVFMNVDEDGHLKPEPADTTLVEDITQEKVEEQPRTEEDMTIQEQIRGEEPAQDEPELETTPDTVNFDTLSEMTKLPKEELYKVPIPLGDERDPVELGKLKDQFVEAERFRDKQQEMTEALADQQNELMARRREVDSIVQALGAQVTPELQSLINQQSEEAITRERKAVLNVIPEWSDPKVAANDIGAITDFAGVYGYTPTEVNNIVDHRLFKLLRDVALGHKRVKEARKLRKPPKTDVSKRTTVSRKVDVKQLIDRAHKTGSKDHIADAMLGVVGASNVNE